MEELTPRESGILKLLTAGFDNKEIAEIIYVSKHTVKAHVSAIIRKLNARNRTNVIYIAMKNKLVD